MTRLYFLSVSFPDFSLPLKDPVLVFSLMLFIILLAPIVLGRFRLPGIIGLIIAGVIIGPNGFNFLARNDAIVLFGTVGLLYIMFLAGLELDLTEFKKFRHRSLLFGVFTFFIPSVAGFPVCYYLLNYDLTASLLISSMFATHTLIAYPIVSRLGIARNEAVSITVGGTIITDTAVLILLSVIINSSKGELGMEFWARLVVSIIVFMAVVMVFFPPLARWFFKNIEGEKTSQYIFVMAMLFLAAFLARLAGLEPIVGAFFAGLALNRLIPPTSSLMNRIEFAGNALFIPFFLISVGMLVDMRVLLKGPQAILVALSLTATAIFGKWLASFITQQIFRYRKEQRGLIFGLSNAHAAATLAVILIGFNLKILDEHVLNGTIILILITCLVASFVTERAGRKIALMESDKKFVIEEEEEKILIPISNPATIEAMVDLAIMMKDAGSKQPISALAIVREDHEARDKVAASNKILERAVVHASAADAKVKILTRVDLNVASGISRAIKELNINTVIIGSSEKAGTAGIIFGTMLDNLLNYTRQMIMVCHVSMPLNLIRRLLVAVPDNAEFEKGFHRWLLKIVNFSKQAGAAIKIFSSPKTSAALLAYAEQSGTTIEQEVFTDMGDLRKIARVSKPDDLIVVVSARRGTLSHDSTLDNVSGNLAKHFPHNSFIIIYPEQIFANSENVYTTQDPHFIL